MAWVIKRTDTFLESFAQVRDNKKVIAELGKKLARLQEDPLHVGGWLSGILHGKKSTLIVKTIPAHIFPRRTGKDSIPCFDRSSRTCV